jgi:hypothetical protein
VVSVYEHEVEGTVGDLPRGFDRFGPNDAAARAGELSSGHNLTIQSFHFLLSATGVVVSGYGVGMVRWNSMPAIHQDQF